MSRSNVIGKAGEDFAANYLLKQGYTIITRRHRSVYGEIDLIAMEDDTFIFVEVKSSDKLDAELTERIGTRKLDQLCKAVDAYRFEFDLRDRDFRLDLILVRSGQIEHFKNLLSLG